MGLCSSLDSTIERAGARLATGQPGGRFLFAVLALFLIYFWTLGEQTSFSLQVRDGFCTAFLPERSISIECTGLEEGRIGLYYGDPEPGGTHLDPWQWLLPDSSWGRIAVSTLASEEAWSDDFGSGALGRWQIVDGKWRLRAGELQPTSDRAVIVRPETTGQPFEVQATLRRGHENAGILLLEPGGGSGWLFIVSAQERRGTWWRWADGRATRPLAGAPFQKPLLAQSQSFIREILYTFQGALLVLIVVWLLMRAMRRLSPVRLSGRLGRPRVNDRLLLGFAVLVVFAVSLVIAGDLLERIPHVQDSITYLFQAQTFAKGHLTAPAPARPDFFHQEFIVVDGDRWFGKYPPGFPLLLAIGVLLGAPWLISPFLAALTVPLLYILGSDLYGRRTARLGVLFGLVSPFFLILSGTMMSHAAELFWIALFMVGWVRSGARHLAAGRPDEPGNRRSWPWLLAAGVALGMAILTRQLSALTVGAVLVGATVLWPSAVGSQRMPPLVQRLRPALGLFVVTVPFIALLLGYQWAVTGDPLQDPRLLYWPVDSLGFGGDVGLRPNAFIYDEVDGEPILVWQYDNSQPPRGHTPQRGIYNLQQNWLWLTHRLFGWLPLLSMAFIWLLFLSGRARGPDWILLMVIAGLMVVHVFYWADGIMYGPRYLYATLPAFILLTARGIQATARWLGGRGLRPGTPADKTLAIRARWAVGLVVALLILGNMLFYLPSVLGELRGYNFISRQELSLVESAVDERALVFVDPGPGDWWIYGRVFGGNTPWLDGPILYARDLGWEANIQLLADYPDRSGYRLVGDTLERIGP